MATRRRGTLAWLLAGLLAGAVAPPSVPGRAASSTPVAAQEPAPQPAPQPPDPPVASSFLETTTTELVLIEVYARDRKGRLIRDLAPGDFTLKIDSQTRPKPIVSLEWIEPPPGAAPVPAAPPSVPGGAPAAEAPAAGAPAAADHSPAGRRDWPRRFLLFFDDATSSAIQMTNARRQAMAFLERPGLPTDQFALASYSEKRRLEILQDFTTDRPALRQVLESSLADKVRMSDYSSERIARREEISRKRQEAGQDAMSGASMVHEADRMAESYAAQDSALMGRVLTSVRTLVEAISPWPGYKAVVFIGEGIPEDPAMDYGIDDARQALTSELGGLAMAAGGANVTLHAVHVDGLPAGSAQEVGAAVRRSNAMAMLALDTGGLHVTSNDLVGAFGTVERGAEGYYLLAYAPEGPPDGRYHTVDLKVNRKGVVLRYRRGFTRFRPEEVRTRAIQAAYLAPDLHAAMGLDLAAVVGPAKGNDRLLDLVLYLPPGRALFLPESGGPAARLDVGIVALDRGGRETLRLARRVRLTPEVARAGADRPLAIDFFSRVVLPDRSHTITAVVADMQSGSIGAARLEIEPANGSATGLSLYALDERSLWVEVEPGRADRPEEERPLGSTVGPALRTRFAPWERVSCGFLMPPTPPGGAEPTLRLVVRRGDEVVRTHPVKGGRQAGRADGVLHDEEVPTAGLADGEYRLTIEEARPDGPATIGQASFRIEAAEPR